MAQAIEIKSRGVTPNKLVVNSDGSIPIKNAPADTIAVSGTVTAVPGAPTGYKFYVYSLSSVAGVAAANNFLSVFNPVGSGKSVVFYQAIVQSFSGGASTATASMDIMRTTAASAGTLVSAANVGKFVTADPNPAAEVRTGNPTVTTAVPVLLATAPSITSAGSGASATGGSSGVSGASFLCTPGQGLVMRTSAGDVDQLWNLTFTWAEF